MRAFAFLLLLLLLGVARAEAAVTYVKPHWSLVSEWSPASERADAADAHSAAMQKYSQALEDNPQMKPCVYC